MGDGKRHPYNDRGSTLAGASGMADQVRHDGDGDDIPLSSYRPSFLATDG
jgi:hypothetical protein